MRNVKKTGLYRIIEIDSTMRNFKLIDAVYETKNTMTAEQVEKFVANMTIHETILNCSSWGR